MAAVTALGIAAAGGAPGAHASGAPPPQPRGPGGAGPPDLLVRAGAARVFPQRGSYCWTEPGSSFCLTSVFGPYGSFKPGPRETLPVRSRGFVMIEAGTAVDAMKVSGPSFHPAAEPRTATRDRWRFRAPVARRQRVISLRLDVRYRGQTSAVPYFFRLRVSP